MKYIKISDEDNIMFNVGFDLYQNAFPLNERRLKNEQIKALYDPEYYFIEAFEDSGTFIGIVLYWKTSSFIYIEHFAIAQEQRGKGYGSKILSDFLNAHSSLPAILEIEPIVDEVTRARKRFYDKFGFVQLDVKHMQLQFHKDCGELELKILSKPEISKEFYSDFRTYLDTTIAKYTC